MAVLLVVTIVVATIVALRRPELAAQLPIAGLAVALGYFAIALAVTVQMLSELFPHACPRSSGASTGYPGPRAKARGRASTTSLATRP